MNKEQEFLENLFNISAQPINIFIFLFQILICALLCLLIAFFYARFGNSLSNRKALARNFILIGLTTMLIITIVKSSLALSLGLVGALSIVRFRTAIKEPEELAYFFMVIAVGLGVGAGQILVTLIGVLAMCIFIFIVNKQQKSDVLQNLIISFNRNENTDEAQLVSILEKHTSQLNLRRMDSTAEQSEIAFTASFNDFEKLLATKKAVEAAYPDATISFLEIG